MKGEPNMDEKALSIVREYIQEHQGLHTEVYIITKMSVLQNCRYLIESNLPDGRCYDLTYSGNINEWRLSVYKKIESHIIEGEE